MYVDTRPPRETKRARGRVYQRQPGGWKVAIDWVPEVPILGYAVLKGGQAVFHPTEGKVVCFPGPRRWRSTTQIAVRTAARPDLLELFDLATQLAKDLKFEIRTNSILASRSRSEISPVAPRGY
jgi:hypothetical protein